MIIKLDWYNCTALPQWEAQIHHMLEEAAHYKTISHASIRVEDTPGTELRFHLVTLLRMPGPDVIAHGDGHTFEEAMLNMGARLRRTLRSRALNEQRPATAPVPA
jgi:hypothetical protein